VTRNPSRPIKPPPRHAQCELCPSLNARLVYRLEPRTWREKRRRFCQKCSTKRGYKPVDFGRGNYAGGKVPG